MSYERDQDYFLMCREWRVVRTRALGSSVALIAKHLQVFNVEREFGIFAAWLDVVYVHHDAMRCGTPAASALRTVPLAQGFALEPSPVADGTVPDRVIAELRTARASAKALATAFSDAVQAQALKYSVEPSALRRFVCALEDDAVEKLSLEAASIERLIG